MHNQSHRLRPPTWLAAVGLSFALLAPEVASAEFHPWDGGLTALLAPQLEGKLNINTATETEWELLPGIGPSTAKKIVAYRSKYPFKEVSHVMRIKGIGRKTFDSIRPFLSTQGTTTLHVVGQAPRKGSDGKPAPAKPKP